MHGAPVMAVVGALLGFLSGMFGVGGSSIATPLLRLLGVPQLVALATPLPMTVPAAVMGGWYYWRRGQVDLRAAAWTALGGVPCVALGALASAEVPGRLLMLLAGALVTGAGLRILRSPAPSLEADAPKAGWGGLVLLGAGVGLLSGLLANGGGFLLLPAYLLLFHMEPQAAAATSLVAVALMALPGIWVHARLGHIDPGMAAALCIGVVPFTYLGARVGSRLHGDTARRLFGWTLLAFGLLFLIRTLFRAWEFGWTG